MIIRGIWEVAWTSVFPAGSGSVDCSATLFDVFGELTRADTGSAALLEETGVLLDVGLYIALGWRVAFLFTHSAHYGKDKEQMTKDK